MPGAKFRARGLGELLSLPGENLGEGWSCEEGLRKREEGRGEGKSLVA